MSKHNQVETEVTILSYNLWMHKAYDELLGLVEEHNVDILCLQECRPEHVTPIIGELRLVRSDALGKLGLAIYVRRDQWSVRRSENRRLPGASYERVLSSLQRTRLQLVELKNVKDEHIRFVVANIHIAHLAASGRARRNQSVHGARMTLEFANGTPFVLSGDFNHPFAEGKLVRAMERVGLKHTVSANGRVVTYRRWPRRTFDRMFFRGLNSKDMYALPFGASDHTPILGKFRFT